MAIAFSAANAGGHNGGSTTTLSWNHTCAGPNPLLLVGVIGDTSLDDIVSVTYNGVALTLVDKEAAAGVTRWVYLYRLVGAAVPTGAAHAIVITCGTAHYLFGLATSYTGVKDAAPDNFDSTLSPGPTNTETTLTTALTPSVANCWVMLLEGGYSAVTTDPTAGAGLVRRISETAFGVAGLFDSNGAALAAGVSATFQTNRAAISNRITHVRASFAPATGGISYTLTATPGPYVQTGTSAVLRAARTLSASGGAYALAGTNASLRAARRLVAGAGTYTLTGTPVDLRLGAGPAAPLTAVPGVYALTGTAATLRASRRLEAIPGSYHLTGTSAVLVSSGHPIDATRDPVTTTFQIRRLVAGTVQIRRTVADAVVAAAHAD